MTMKLGDLGITDQPFEDAADVGSIRYRLHPLDVGFELRGSGTAIKIAPNDVVLRVSYADASGERRVMRGPREAVLYRLRRLGYRPMTARRS